MRRRAAMAALVALILLPSCGEPEPAETPWGSQAEEVVALLADAYDVSDPYELARFFSAGGTLDLTVWGQGIAKTPEEVVASVQQLWFIDHAKVRADHLFVSREGALVWWSAYSDDLPTIVGSNWVQSYSFAAGRTASQGFRNVEGFDQRDTPEQPVDTDEELAAVELGERYAAAWRAKSRSMLESIYSPSVVVHDDILGLEWRSLDGILAELDSTPPVQLGPTPNVFVYQRGSDVQVIVLLQIGGDCPRLEARRLVLAGERIVNEIRFTHVPSAQRCLTDLPDSWWTTFELPVELLDNVTEVIDVGGRRVDLINAEPAHEEFSSWLFQRFIAAGIGLPEVSAIWFPPAPECTELAGLAIESDERYEGRHTVVICFTVDRLTWEDSESGWFPPAAAFGLHELSHIWMVDRLTDDTRAAFNELAGLEVWRQGDAEWAQRGVEHAAFTIPWAITGTADALWPFQLAEATCEELSERYRLLTEHEPLTTCGEDGWT
ncbi:MAG: hypothetical protein GY720_21045 [bacterium]|nr:hypothetical protein [bacterium]